ncbi:MAG: C40 family peptidase [Chitinophagaceae bacterium]|nr:C40 family peptidase [Chitinophagaceae bacterium]MCW5906040.1 C40 family peptidase [Chitinophagaceae bacterium]
MNYAATIVSVAPLRYEASHKSEMINQLLFGECVIITDSTKDFFKVTCLYDGYEGWCAKNQLAEVDENFYTTNHQKIITTSIAEATCNGQNMYLSSGSFIGCINHHQLNIGNTNFVFNNTYTSPIHLQKIMFSYINTPYLWGGKSIFGIDCSGFVQQVYKLLGIPLKRDAHQQAEQGNIVGFLQEATMGDLAFFDNEEGKIIHVGILLNESEIIHASGQVRKDKIDNAGIIHTETQKRTHNLRIIKRML